MKRIAAILALATISLVGCASSGDKDASPATSTPQTSSVTDPTTSSAEVNATSPPLITSVQDACAQYCTTLDDALAYLGTCTPSTTNSCDEPMTTAE